MPHMGGVNVGDQRLNSHAYGHKPMRYFCRRVFDQTFPQAISNAYLLFAAWVEMLATQSTAALESLKLRIIKVLNVELTQKYSEGGVSALHLLYRPSKGLRLRPTQPFMAGTSLFRGNTADDISHRALPRYDELLHAA